MLISNFASKNVYYEYLLLLFTKIGKQNITKIKIINGLVRSKAA